MKQPIWINGNTPPQLYDVIDQILETDKDRIQKAEVESANAQDKRISNVLWFDHPEINSWLMSVANRANRDAFGVDAVMIPEIQWTSYPEGGKFDWHQDVVINSGYAYDRKLSITVQLSDSDEYEGGDFELSGVSFDKEKVREKGTIIVFPSFARHRVTPITKGTRKSLVAWVEGPEWR